MYVTQKRGDFALNIFFNANGFWILRREGKIFSSIVVFLKEKKNNLEKYDKYTRNFRVNKIKKKIERERLKLNKFGIGVRLIRSIVFFMIFPSLLYNLYMVIYIDDCFFFHEMICYRAL